MSEIPVAFVGLGPVGCKIARRLVIHGGIRVVAAVDPDDSKLGRDLGDVLGLPATGVAISAEVPLLPGGSASRGVVIHATTSRLADAAPQIIAAVDAGWNVLSTCEELAFASAGDPAIGKRIDEAASRAGLTVVGAGINPGFLLDKLILLLTGVCVEVDAVTGRRVVDTDQRRLPLQRKAGVGLSVEEFQDLAARSAIGHVGLRQSAFLVARHLGWPVDHYVEQLDPVVAAADQVTGLGPVPAGRVIGQHQVARLISAGQERLVFDLEMSAGASAVDEIVIEGAPPIHQVIVGGINGDIGTEAVVANLVPAVVDARPGLLDTSDVIAFWWLPDDGTLGPLSR